MQILLLMQNLFYALNNSTFCSLIQIQIAEYANIFMFDKNANYINNRINYIFLENLRS